MANSNKNPRWTTDGARVVFNEVPLLEMLPDEAPRDFVRRQTQAQRLVSATPDGSETRALDPEEAGHLTRDRGARRAETHEHLAAGRHVVALRSE